MQRKLESLSLAVAISFLALGGALAQDKPNAIKSPATKTIGSAKPQVEPALIVLNSRGASIKEGKLVLTGISPNSIMFADRPVRAAGHVLTAHLLEEWATGKDSFATDPPNATVSVLKKDGSDVLDAVVTLNAPKMEDDNLSFDVEVLEGSLDGADGPASTFIDIIGMPFTPRSFAGVARRSAFRGAWYGGPSPEPLWQRRTIIRGLPAALTRIRHAIDKGTGRSLLKSSPMRQCPQWAQSGHSS